MSPTSTATRPDETSPAAVDSTRAPLVCLGLLLAAVALLLVVERTGLEPDGTVLRGAAAWTAAAAVVVVGLGLLALGLSRTGWAYPDDEGARDLRIDVLRGVAIVFVVLNHLPLPSLFRLLSEEAVGTVSGAEVFVAVSGVVVGMAYGSRLRRTDLVEVTGALWRRAWVLYRTALLVVVGVYLLTLLPGVDGQAVTTFAPPGGERTTTYPNVERFADYPVPGFVVRDLLLLELGPWQFNVMGLYVVLLLLAPLLLAALRRRLVLLVLAVSWGLYALTTGDPVRLLPSQFEDPFPLLTWQVLFVTGVSVGWYRAPLLAFARRPAGRGALVAVVLLFLAGVLFAASSTFLSNGYDVRLALLSEARFDALYAEWARRPALGLWRLVDVWLVLVTLYALVTAFWRPVAAALGWLLVPLGRHSLHVFVLHVPAALLVAHLPGVGDSVALGTLVHGAVLAALWAMARSRVLFSVLPH